MNDIKDYRDKELKYFVIANILLMIVTSNILIGFNLNTINTAIWGKIVNISLVSIIIYAYVFLIDSLFSSKLKYYLLYLGITKLPGTTIFSKLSKCSDIRFTQDEINRKYKSIYDNLPTNKKERYRYENSHWYKIYKKHETNKMIEVSNRDYLLSRDLYISTLFFMIVYLIFTQLFTLIQFSSSFIIYLIVMMVITNIAAHLKGSRFVLNVIACDLASDK